ncbi:MAG TPA: hypothetical protein VGY66_15490 [Gemmataceae bacterium]|nr:hypothetical protein [Gemmataceae bacterium]
MLARSIQRRFGFLILALVLGSGGCGLTDYEARLEVQEKRLKYMEEENKNLNDRPVNLADRVTEEGGVKYKQFFLRVPLGVSHNPEEKGEGKFDVYKPLKPDSGFQKILLAVENDDDVEKFKTAVVAALLKAPATPTVKSIPRPLDKPQAYDFYQKDGVQLYIPQNSYYRVAIAFFPSGSANQTLVDERIKYSLASFADGRKAEAQRRVSRAQSTKKEAPDKGGPKKKTP